MEKNYSVKKFVYKYLETNDTDKEKFLKDRIVCTYVPFEDKLTICEKIIDATNFNNGKYVRNTSSASVLYKLNLVNLYTDINIDFGKDFLGDYNLMEEYDVLDRIINIIPDNERMRFSDVFYDVMGDKEYNACSIMAIYTSIKETFSTTFSSVFDGFSEYFNSVNIKDILPKQKE